MKNTSARDTAKFESLILALLKKCQDNQKKKFAVNKVIVEPSQPNRNVANNLLSLPE